MTDIGNSENCVACVRFSAQLQIRMQIQMSVRAHFANSDGVFSLGMQMKRIPKPDLLYVWLGNHTPGTEYVYPELVDSLIIARLVAINSICGFGSPTQS